MPLTLSRFYSVNALKMRLNQDSAGAAEQLEAMMHQIEDGKRDRQFESEKVDILLEFLNTVSHTMHSMCDNSVLLEEIDTDVVPNEDERGTLMESDGLAELQRKKRELRRKVLMEKNIQKFSQQCYNRASLISMELQHFQENASHVREDLEHAENKIDSELLHIRTLEAELAKLRLTVEMGKTNLAKAEKSLVRFLNGLACCVLVVVPHIALNVRAADSDS
jgi:chromosome segregation ATPase